MDRNSIIGILLITAILIGFAYFNKPSEEQVMASKHRADSIALIQEQQKAAIAKQVEQQGNTTTKAVAIAVDTIDKQKLFASQYGIFAPNATGEDKRYVIENDNIKLVLSAKGGRPCMVELKKYKTWSKEPLILLSGDSTQFGFSFYAQNKPISTNELYFKAINYSDTVKVANSDTLKSLVLRLEAGNNQYIEYVYSLKPSSYMVDIKVNLVGMNNIIAANTTNLDLKWAGFAPATERSWKTESTYATIAFRHFKDETETFKNSKEEEVKDIPTRIKWIASKQQFFSTILIAQDAFSNADMKCVKEAENSKFLNHYNVQAGIAYENKAYQQIGLSLYVGPNHFNTLKKYNLGLEDVVSLGRWIIKWINRFFIIPIFNFLSQYIFNYGIIILVLSVIIKIVLHPLTSKSFKSMAKMKVLKPQIDEINERIPADKAMERQQATMALYKKAGVNPMGGCLPLLLQMPILIAMFRFFPASIELRQQSFLWATDLSSYDSIFSWTTYIPLITPFYGNHISLFTILMTVTTIITTKMSNQANASSTQMPGMKAMTYIMPIMFMFILNSFSAALTYYYLLINIITILQNEYLKRTIDEQKLLAQLNENKKKPVKKSKFQERLEQAAKAKGYKMPK